MTDRQELGQPCSRCSRRGLLRAGLGLTASTLVMATPPATAAYAAGVAPSDTPLPEPIPEVDRFGHHNVPPAPYSEPSEIFNFRGVVASAILAGRGHDQNGELVKFGGPGTDVRFMQGEYVTADGAHHQGAFIHI